MIRYAMLTVFVHYTIIISDVYMVEVNLSSIKANHKAKDAAILLHSMLIVCINHTYIVAWMAAASPPYLQQHIGLTG